MKQKNENYKVGRNEISERLCIVNGKILPSWFNLEKTMSKIKCKLKFVPQPKVGSALTV